MAETSVCALAAVRTRSTSSYREVGIRERVVGRPAVDRRDRGGRPIGVGLRPQPDRHLVELVQAALGCDLDERDREQWLDGVHERRLEHARRGALAAVRAEPRLRRDECAQLGFGQAREVKHPAAPAGASRSRGVRA